jgi:ketosteroid isomerase-like protein
MADADNRADADAFAATLSEDAVIMAPGMPPLIGRETCMAFVRDVFACYPKRHIEETIEEVHVSGDLAFERASFVQEVDDPEAGGIVQECGRGLRIYRRSADGWKAARVIWHAEGNDEEQESVSASAPA